MVAGHEVIRPSNLHLRRADSSQTTAHSLAFAFALLALYPDKQEELYQHIKRVLPDGRMPVRIPRYMHLCSQAHNFIDV